jgi:uncharacterized membrane protein
MSTYYNRIAAGDVGRIAALSDGIFAFAATVLVIEVHTPDSADIHTEAQLLAALSALAPQLLTWLLSLMTLGIFWVGQQTQLNQLKRADRDLTWLHFLFLAVIAVLPFSTRLLSEFFEFRVAFLIYWANILLAGVTIYMCWAYAWRAKLVGEETTEEVTRAIRRRIVIAQSLYGIGAVVGLFSVPLGMLVIIVIQLNYAIAPRVRFFSRL